MRDAPISTPALAVAPPGLQFLYWLVRGHASAFAHAHASGSPPANLLSPSGAFQTASYSILRYSLTSHCLRPTVAAEERVGGERAAAGATELRRRRFVRRVRGCVGRRLGGRRGERLRFVG